jgi:hypothetical protein
MLKLASVTLGESGGPIQFNGGGISHIVQTPAGVLYAFFCDTSNDLAFRKSTDGGLTWGTPTVMYTGSIFALACWYDRWSGINADLIHLAYTEIDTSDVRYRTINVASADALSTETVIFAGASTAGGGALAVARARGGNVYCRVTIDAGAEGGFFRLPNANVPNGAWDAARTIDEALATNDKWILLPGFAADNQDIIMMFWDTSTDEITRKLYDDSANTWAESTAITAMVDTTVVIASPHFAAAVDLANSKHWFIAWSGVDTATAQLRCWTVTESTFAEVTAVVSSSTDDQGLAALAFDTVTGYLVAYYVGATDGSETFSTAVKVYYKISTDGGTTWGPETVFLPEARSIKWITTCPRFSALYPPPILFHDDMNRDEVKVALSFNSLGVRYQLGV